MTYRNPVWGIGVALGVAALLTACTPTQSAPAPNTWQSIFDGETLDGWTPKIRGAESGENFNEIFRAGDGVLSVSFENQDAFDNRFGHIFYETPLSHYRLRLDYRFLGEAAAGGPSWAIRNSGVMLHAQSPESMDVEQAFPVSVEAQFLGALEAEPNRTTANICTPGTNIEMGGELVTQHCIPSQTPGRELGEWVAFEVEVCGSQSMHLFIEGESAFKLGGPQYDPNDGDAAKLITGDLLLNDGYIALQAESHPLEMRNIELLQLTAETCGDAVSR